MVSARPEAALAETGPRLQGRARKRPSMRYEFGTIKFQRSSSVVERARRSTWGILGTVQQCRVSVSAGDARRWSGDHADSAPAAAASAGRSATRLRSVPSREAVVDDDQLPVGTVCATTLRQQRPGGPAVVGGESRIDGLGAPRPGRVRVPVLTARVGPSAARMLGARTTLVPGTQAAVGRATGCPALPHCNQRHRPRSRWRPRGARHREAQRPPGGPAASHASSVSSRPGRPSAPHAPQAQAGGRPLKGRRRRRCPRGRRALRQSIEQPGRAGAENRLHRPPRHASCPPSAAAPAGPRGRAAPGRPCKPTKQERATHEIARARPRARSGTVGRSAQKFAILTARAQALGARARASAGGPMRPTEQIGHTAPKGHVRCGAAAAGRQIPRAKARSGTCRRAAAQAGQKALHALVRR
jgi:hypothetical protein